MTSEIQKILTAFDNAANPRSYQGEVNAHELRKIDRLSALRSYLENSPKLLVDAFLDKDNFNYQRTRFFASYVSEACSLKNEGKQPQLNVSKELNQFDERREKTLGFAGGHYPYDKWKPAWEFLRKNVWVSETEWRAAEKVIPQIHQNIIEGEQSPPLDIFESCLGGNPALARLSKTGAWGYIQWLRSETNKSFPEFVLSGDTSMSTDGWATLTSIDKPEIVIGDLTGWEFGEGGPQAFEDRLNKQLKRNDLRYIKWIPIPGTRGKREQEDIYVKGGKLEKEKTESTTEFLENGGSIIGAFRQ